MSGGWVLGLIEPEPALDRSAFNRTVDQHGANLGSSLVAHLRHWLCTAAMVLMAVLASTMFGQRNGVEAGGLISYEPNLLYKRAAILADKILKGAKPADLPVEFPIRLISSSISKLRKALGLTVALLASADEFDESSEARLGRRLVDLRSQVGVNLTPEPAVATNGY